MDELEQAFLDELTELSRKHGITIDGCGCCGSPYLTQAPADAEQGFYVFDTDYSGALLFVSPTDSTKWARYGLDASPQK